MRNRLVLLGLMGAGFFFTSSTAHAHVRSIKSLPPDECQAYEASQQRLAIFDQELRALEQRHAGGQIDRTEYRYEEHDLLILISGEANLENRLLRQSQPLISEGAREVIENIERYAVLVPAYIIAVTWRGLPGLVSLIH